jgi:methionine synthase II (cobalamin-independent)
MKTHAHFVGSIGLDTAEQVFATVGKTVGAHIKRCPDGEVAGRRMWVGWQYPVLRGNTALEVVGNQALGGSGLCPIRVKAGTSDADIHFGELGYAREARASYQDFIEAREQGILPKSARFQVSLPTPWAVIRSFIVAQDVPRVASAYQEAMVLEVQRLCAAIPHRDLAIQWDVCIEMIQWEGSFPYFSSFPGMKPAFERQFAVLGKAVPSDVQMGIHLCYGDLDAKHFIEPRDTTKAVELANLIIASINRPLTWLHLPVPIERDDVAYFAPLAGLNRPADTELYLGLVHLKDGAEGTLRRMNAARKIVPEFGIATECGISRARTPEIARAIMQVHADAIAAWDK